VTRDCRLIGVGVGPGDPELMTLKAVRALAAADVLAYFAKAGKESNARQIAASHIRPDVIELPLGYPVTTELARDDPAYRQATQAFFDNAAATIAGQLDRQRIVAVLSEGDPLFYGSYMHVHVRLADRYPTEVIAGVTSLSGCWSAAGIPIARDTLSSIHSPPRDVENVKAGSPLQATQTLTLPPPQVIPMPVYSDCRNSAWTIAWLSIMGRGT